jgi:hypothetical protein
MKRRTFLASAAGLFLPAVGKAGEFYFGGAASSDPVGKGEYYFGGGVAAEGNRDTPLADRIVYIGSPGCGPCERVKRETFPELVKAGWLIGPEPWNHIQIDDGKDSHDAVYNVDSGIPAFILLYNEKEAKRRVGFVGSEDLAEWYNDHVTSRKVKKPKVYESSGNAFRNTSSDTPRWTFSGRNLAAHLMSAHRYTSREVTGRSWDQLIRLHSRAHNTPGAGYNPSRRVAARSSAACPTG